MPPKGNTCAAPAAAAVVASRGEDPTANPTAAGGVDRRRARQEPAEEQRVVRVGQKVLEGAMWTWGSPVRSILLHRFNLEIGKMGLREFIRECVGIDYPIEQIGNYTMDVVVTNPNRYIPEELRESIERLRPFRQLRDTNQAMKDADILNERGVVNLFQWKNYDQKGIVSLCSQGMLNGVHVQDAEILQRGKVLSDLYDSVYNAKWSYVVKNSQVSKERLCLVVKSGRPPEVWTNEEVDYFTHSVDNADAATNDETNEKEIEYNASGVEPPRKRLQMMVLTSSEGWPYGLSNEGKFLDCYITKEVERAWRVVRNVLRDWFIAKPREPENPRPRILTGTPGIGKSMAAGSYLLYQLLQYDGERLPVVAYFIDRLTYIFDKTTKRVTVYNDVKGLAMVDQLARKCKGYTIYDCSAEKVEPPIDLPGSWGTVLISPPSEKHFKNWEKQNTALNFFMNCPEENDIKAMCAWRKRRKPDELHDYWIMIKDRMSHVGPVLRYIFDEGMYTIRSLAARKALAIITPSTAERCYGVYRKLWLNANPLQTIVKIVRVTDNSVVETFYNDPICPEVRDELRNSLGESIDSSEVLMTLLLPIDALISRALNAFGLKVFTERNFTLRIHECLEEIPPPWMRRPQSCVLRGNVRAGPTYQEEIPYEIDSNRGMKLEFERLYKPSNPNFPVVDAFFFARGPRKTIVGIQTTVSKYCHTTTSKVKALHDHLATLFMDWKKISKDLSWEIIYVRRTARKTKLTWRRCDVVVPKGQKNVKEVKDEHEAIAKHWNEEVHQYQL